MFSLKQKRIGKITTGKSVRYIPQSEKTIERDKKTPDDKEKKSKQKSFTKQ